MWTIRFFALVFVCVLLLFGCDQGAKSGIISIYSNGDSGTTAASLFTENGSITVSAGLVSANTVESYLYVKKIMFLFLISVL